MRQLLFLIPNPYSLIPQIGICPANSNLSISLIIDAPGHFVKNVSIYILYPVDLICIGNIIMHIAENIRQIRLQNM